MTIEEHEMMIAVLVQQLQLTKSILELLKSRDLLDSGDLAAFLSLTQTQEAGESLVDAAHQLYHRAAKHAGVVTGLES